MSQRACDAGEGCETCIGVPDERFCEQIGVLEKMPEGKKGGRRITKQGQQDCDRIAKEIFESKQ